jgi:hypothetical protein
MEGPKVRKLSLRKKYAKGALGSVPHNPHNGLAKVLGARHFGRERTSVKMRLDARLARAERAFLSGLGQAHGATHSHYLFWR